jgi:hypothetical protein
LLAKVVNEDAVCLGIAFKLASKLFYNPSAPPYTKLPESGGLLEI